MAHRDPDLKYIFITGGVMSGLGKGITTAAIGRLLKCYGISVTAIKIDPYVNVDAGTMNPYQHGEVWVTEDGGEIDMDLGHYERFLDQDLLKDHNITTGQIYLEVIQRERKGEFLGQTVQIIPHITDAIKSRIHRVARRSKSQVALVEIGGTVGDIESEPFLEAARQIQLELGSENVAFLHLTLVPISAAGEQKTKPTQHSVAQLRQRGIQPDAIIARCSQELLQETKRKISLFCNVPEHAVISNPDLENIYELPLVYQREGLGDYLISRLGLGSRTPQLDSWIQISRKFCFTGHGIPIAIVGKYVSNRDSYISIVEAIKHAAAELNLKPELIWIEAEDLESNPQLIQGCRGILIPGGFGKRGSQGKIMAIKYARESKKPFLGLCFGFQLGVIEYARNVAGIEDATSREFDPDPRNPVIDLIPEQREIKELGATMRLGALPVKLIPGTQIFEIYGRQEVILERHRHRYELNPDYIPILEQAGLRFSGFSPDGRAEVMELPGHPFFIGTQFHPEFKSRPGRPSPVFKKFLQACSSHPNKELS